MAMLKVGRIIQLSSTWRLVKTSKLLAVRVLALNTWVLWQKETLRLWVQIFLLHPHAHSVAIRWWYCHTYDDHDMVCSPSPNLYCIFLMGPRSESSHVSDLLITLLKKQNAILQLLDIGFKIFLWMLWGNGGIPSFLEKILFLNFVLVSKALMISLHMQMQDQLEIWKHKNDLTKLFISHSCLWNVERKCNNWRIG